MDCELALTAFHELLKAERLKCSDKQRDYSLRRDGGLLSDCHKAVFRGCWQSHTYQEMAAASEGRYTNKSLSVEASRLFAMIRQLLEVDVCKETFYRDLSLLLQPLITEAKREAIAKKIDDRAFQQRQIEALSALRMLLSEYGDAITGLKRQACRRVLLDRGEIKTVPSVPEWNTDPLLTIQKLPPSADRYSGLEQFAGYLLVLSENNELVEELQEWGRVYYEQSWGDLVRELDRRNKEYQGTAHPSLLIEIRSCTSAKEGQYRIKAWFVRDVWEYRETGRGHEQLRLPDISEEADYSLSELRDLLPLYLENLPEELHEPDIQLFLPGVLVDESVDQWRSSLAEHEEIEQLGVDYVLAIRLGDRLKRSSKFTRSWKRRWHGYETVVDVEDCRPFFASISEDGLDDELLGERPGDVNQTVGLRLTSSSETYGTGEMLNGLLREGYPLAIWCRKRVLGEDVASALDRVLERCSLRELPGEIQRIRQSVPVEDRDRLQLGTVGMVQTRVTL